MTNSAPHTTPPLDLASPASALPYLYGGPLGTIQLKQEPMDFIVQERLSFTPEGTGVHLFLYITKVGQNTEWVAKQLARWANVPPIQVGYAGQKDRHACTSQWFSVYWPLETPPVIESIQIEGVRVEQAVFHDRKLKIGALESNHFKITCRDYTGDKDALVQRFAQICKEGVPNYYGEQRFGREGQNLTRAYAWLEGGPAPRDKFYKHLYRSVLRSHWFNQVLAARLRQGVWQTFIEGDVLAKAGSSSFFYIDAWSDVEAKRLAAQETHITGPLIGKMRAADTLSPFEINVLGDINTPNVLELLRSDFGRRALRVCVQEGQLTLQGNDVIVEFTLPKGAYATCVLRELVQWESYANFSE